ncbi:MAG TPA: aldehyde dehydrogenase family protein [Anaeromyxobacteraceae bacterium]|nr:aldehyde dehydrogenase family protein [Anaeromyxobacteraceae bacterium]
MTLAIPPRPVPSTAPGDSAEEIAYARRVFAAQEESRWRIARTTAAERTARLRRLRDAVDRRRQDVCAALEADFGKCPAETEITEVWTTLVEVGHAIRHLRRWMRPRRVGAPLLLLGTRSEIRYEPRGRALVLAPWNYPFLLTMGPVALAVAAGNTVIARPSEKVPHAGRMLRSLLAEVFPEEEVAVVLGGIDVAEALLDLPFDHVFFTGSTAVGRKVMAAASRHLASVTLELGGKPPAIVDESADVEKAARRIAWGKLVNAGQSCIAPDHVWVHASREQAFLRALGERIAAQYGRTGEERRRSPDLARMVDRHAAARLARWLEEALAAGAKVALGGTADPEARWVEPTVLTDVPLDCALMREEIFGPVLPVLRYRDLGEVLARIRAGPKPLAVYVFGARRANVERVLRETTAGGSGVNMPLLHLANPELPFGGVGESGMGNHHGLAGFRAFSHERAVLTQGPLAFIEALFPPYGTRLSRRIRTLARRLAR